MLRIFPDAPPPAPLSAGARGQAPQCRRRQARLAARSGAPSRQRPPQSRSAQQRGANCAARSQFGMAGASRKNGGRGGAVNHTFLSCQVSPICRLRSRIVAPSKKFVPLRIAFFPYLPFISTTALWRRFSRSSCARSSSALCLRLAVREQIKLRRLLRVPRHRLRHDVVRRYIDPAYEQPAVRDPVTYSGSTASIISFSESVCRPSGHEPCAGFGT